MAGYDGFMRLLDLRSFSSVWYWLALLSAWTIVGRGMLGVPGEVLHRARVALRAAGEAAGGTGVEPGDKAADDAGDKTRNDAGGGTGAVPQGTATAAAQNYLSFMSFSRSGLISQLEYDGYSSADATAAVDGLSVDYAQQAGSSAQGYLEMMPMSRAELIDQLIQDGYTPEQAAAGADRVGL